MNPSSYASLKNSNEIKKVEDLFIRLAEFREKLKLDKKKNDSGWSDTISDWAIKISAYSYAPMLACLIAIYTVDALLPGSSPIIPQWIYILIILSMFLSLIGMILFFGQLIVVLIKLFWRNENKKAQDTFSEIQPYLKYGAELSIEFDLSTLEKAQIGLRQEVSEFNRRGNSVSIFIQHLPSALWWIALLIVFTLFINLRKFQGILADQNVNSYNKLQEALANLIFSNIISYVSPSIILDILMFALVITLLAKTHPILITPAGNRRSKRYEDYSRIIECAKEFRKDTESKKTTKSSKFHRNTLFK